MYHTRLLENGGGGGGGILIASRWCKCHCPSSKLTEKTRGTLQYMVCWWWWVGQGQPDGVACREVARTIIASQCTINIAAQCICPGFRDAVEETTIDVGSDFVQLSAQTENGKNYPACNTNYITKTTKMLRSSSHQFK